MLFEIGFSHSSDSVTSYARMFQHGVEARIV